MHAARALHDAEFPASTAIAVFMAGTIPYFMPEHRFHDLLGKSDHHIARSRAHPGPPGHNKWDYTYSLGRVQPGLVITSGNFAGISVENARRQLADDAAAGFHAAMWIDPIFRSDYFDNRAVIAFDDTHVEQQWAFARTGADLGKVRIERPPYGPPASLPPEWARSRTDGVEIGGRLESAWPLEGRGESRWLWLGEGREEGVSVLVSTAQRTAVDVELDLSPGPGRPDARRTMRLTAEHDAYGERDLTVELDRRMVFRWPLVLEPGATRLRVEVLDRATITPLPNGDSRRLLVSLHRVTVMPSGGQTSPSTP